MIVIYYDDDDIKRPLDKGSNQSPDCAVKSPLNDDANRSKALKKHPHKLHPQSQKKRDEFLSNSEITPLIRIVPSGTHLDRDRLSGPSNWIIYPAYMSYSNSVLGSSPQIEMERFNEYAVCYGVPAANSVWRCFISEHEWFSIPETIIAVASSLEKKRKFTTYQQ